MKQFDKDFEEYGVGLVHHFSAGIYAKETHIPAGVTLTQHRHRFEHLSILAQGEVVVTADGVATVIEAPYCLTMPAGVEHSVRALTDAVWFCVNATSEVDHEAADRSLVE